MSCIIENKVFVLVWTLFQIGQKKKTFKRKIENGNDMIIDKLNVKIQKSQGKMIIKQWNANFHV